MNRFRPDTPYPVVRIRAETATAGNNWVVSSSRREALTQPIPTSGKSRLETLQLEQSNTTAARAIHHLNRAAVEPKVLTGGLCRLSGVADLGI